LKEELYETESVILNSVSVFEMVKVCQTAKTCQKRWRGEITAKEFSFGLWNGKKISSGFWDWSSGWDWMKVWIATMHF